MIKALNGKKTIIGGILHLIWFAIYIYGHITKQYEISDDLQLRGHAIVFVLTGTGIIHKIKKHNEKTV